jgi:uncharacterized protein YjbI with pentapeptide repeats
LRYAQLTHADVENADFRDADLFWTDFHATDWERVDRRGAKTEDVRPVDQERLAAEVWKAGDPPKWT